MNVVASKVTIYPISMHLIAVAHYYYAYFFISVLTAVTIINICLVMVMIPTLCGVQKYDLCVAN